MPSHTESQAATAASGENVMGSHEEHAWDRRLADFVEDEAIPQIAALVNSKLAEGMPVDELIAWLRAGLRTLT